MVRIALRTLRFRKGSFVATFLAMTFGAVLVLACGGLMETGIRGEVPPDRLANARFVVVGDQTWDRTVGDDHEDTDLGERERLPAVLGAELSRVPGVTAAIGDVSVPAALVRPNGLAHLDGHGWASAALAPVELASGKAPKQGEVVLGKDTGARVGQRVELVVRGSPQPFTVSGLVPGQAAFFSDGDLGRLTERPGQVDLIGIQASADAGERIAQAIEGRGAKLLTGDKRGIAEYPGADEAGESLIVLAAVFGGVATMVMLFVVATTLGLSIQQRQRELALLRAIGTTPGQLRRMVIGEALAIAVIATGLGCLLGSYAGEWLFGQLTYTGIAPPAMTHHSGWIPMIVAIGAGLLGAFFGALIAGSKAARTRPTAALADASIQRQWLSAVRVVLAVLAFGGGIALFIVTVKVMNGPTAASTAGPSVVLWAIALALVAPGVTKLLLAVLRWPVQAVTGTAGYLATLSTKTRAVRVAAVVTPIMLATGMATANIYLQTTTVAVANEAFVDNLRADLVVSSTTGEVPPDLVEDVRAVPGVAAASEFATSTVFVAAPHHGELAEDGASVQGVTAASAAATTAVRPTTGSLADLTGATVALPEQYAAALGRGVGDTLTLKLGDGADVDVRIVALYPARKGFETWLMPVALVAQHTTSGLPSQILVRASGDLAALESALGRLAADHPGVVVVDRDTLVSAHSEGQEVGAWINYLMAGMIIAYTAISVVNSLVLATNGRRREFGLQRLTGSTRGQVLRMTAVEAGMTTVIGVVLGTAVALATLMPFTLVTDGSLLPKGPVAIYLCVVAAATVLTFGSTLAATWAGLRTRPIESTRALA